MERSLKRSKIEKKYDEEEIKKEIEKLKTENKALSLNIEEIQKKNLELFKCLQGEKKVSKIKDNHIMELINQLPI
jgi:hypothetical protein